MIADKINFGVFFLFSADMRYFILINAPVFFPSPLVSFGIFPRSFQENGIEGNLVAVLWPADQQDVDLGEAGCPACHLFLFGS